jgi:hypothetical protein
VRDGENVNKIGRLELRGSADGTDNRDDCYIGENREEEETRYLASWFCLIGKDQDKLTADIFESICVITELAGHCTSREPFSNKGTLARIPKYVVTL